MAAIRVHRTRSRSPTRQSSRRERSAPARRPTPTPWPLAVILARDALGRSAHCLRRAGLLWGARGCVESPSGAAAQQRRAMDEPRVRACSCFRPASRKGLASDISASRPETSCLTRGQSCLLSGEQRPEGVVQRRVSRGKLASLDAPLDLRLRRASSGLRSICAQRRPSDLSPPDSVRRVA